MKPCTKRAYASESEARNALKTIKQHPRERIPTRAYVCPDCHRFHLSSAPKRTVKMDPAPKRESLRHGRRATDYDYLGDDQ